jgi:hypothetical protein
VLRDKKVVVGVFVRFCVAPLQWDSLICWDY